MKLYNIKYRDEEVTFSEALIKGLGKNQGLFFPINFPMFSMSEITSLLKMDFVKRSAYIISKYIESELSDQDVLNCVKNAFNFPVPLVFIKNNIAILELFHGPTLAFKDFGCRFMAQILAIVLNQQKNSKPVVVLVATSGDTGAAVAHAFYGINNVHVIILYPKNKISMLQEKLFCTLGGNISTVSINGDFDLCQFLVKQAFDDEILQEKLYLNSANSINISRLLAQICYYFEAFSQLSSDLVIKTKKIVVSVPSGNFGNLTSGLLAQFSGLPIKKFIAATNANNTVPRFLESGLWKPLPTISTFSNSMDVSSPNNWSRIEELFLKFNKSVTELGYGYVDDVSTKKTVQEILDLGYIADPHTAVSYRVLYDQLDSDELGICLGTAHPAKFKELVECFLERKTCILLPDKLKSYMELPILSHQLFGHFSELRDLILRIVLD